jgi:hypothetical protein
VTTSGPERKEVCREGSLKLVAEAGANVRFDF